MFESAAGTASTLTTTRIIAWVVADLDIIASDTATTVQRAAALHRLKYYGAALDRRAASGDTDALAFLNPR